MANNPPSTTGLTLSQTTHMARIAVKYGGILVVALIVGRIFLTSFIAFWRSVNPPPPPPPTVGFGKLPAVNFPVQDESDRPRSYVLETATGTVPSFSDRSKVFLMINATPSLLADQRAREIAANYNFVFEPRILDSNTYRWEKAQPLDMQLEMDIFSQNFTLSSNYLSRPEMLNATNLPDEYGAVQLVKGYLSAANLLPADVATVAGEVKYLKAVGGELTEAVSFSDANFIQVDLNRQPIDGQYRMYGPEGTKGTIHAILGGSFSGRDAVMEMEYTYQNIDYEQIETYPLRTAQEAWNILKSGAGYVAQLGVDPQGVVQQETAVIREVSLGYYESNLPQSYLQPIYVFSGDHGFLGYVPALDPTYIQADL